MDHVQFDALTRRFVFGSLAAAALATVHGVEGAAGKKLSRRKRCKRKKRDFCDGRCCPRPRRCDNAVCVSSCDNSFQCPPRGPVDPFSCNANDSCFCGKTPGGPSACVALPFPTDCNDLPVCGDGVRCPAGLVCFTCSCQGGITPNFRCAPPC